MSQRYVQRRRHRPAVMALVLLHLVLSLGSGFAQVLNVDGHVVAGGGGGSSDGALTISGTVGQADAGNLAAAQLALSGGFWGAMLLTPVAPVASCVPPPPGLVGWWPGEGDAADMVGGNDGTLLNGTTFAPGKVGQALAFNGVDQSVSTSLDVQPIAMPSTTWEAWVFPTRVNYAVRQEILSDDQSQDNSGPGRSVLIERGTANFGVSTGSGVWQPTSVTPNQWQHIAVIYTPNNIEFYKNGARFSLGSPPGDQATDNTLQIGGLDGFANYYQGLIDEISIYNRALSPVEIQALYAAGNAGKCASIFTANDGDWAAPYVTLTNTPEAALMARAGDIDNLGFGWPAGFDPFSGQQTPTHSHPWTPGTNDPPGTDRIMVVSSYHGNPSLGSDGYTDSTIRPDNNVQSVVLRYNLGQLVVTSARLELFVDDLQAPIYGAGYQVRLNGVRAPFLETILNALDQSGPVGQLVSVPIPADFLPLVQSGSLTVNIDDPTTGAGDGYAMDFVKLLLNPKSAVAPQLAIQRVDASTIALAWAARFSGAMLESTGDFSASGSWNAVATTPVVVGTENVVTVPITTGRRFYRLRMP